MTARKKTSPKKPLAKKAAPPSLPLDLATVAGQIPAEILQQLAAAVQSGRWLVCIVSVADGQIHFERTAVNFPTADLDRAVEMLRDDLQKLKG